MAAIGEVGIGWPLKVISKWITSWTSSFFYFFIQISTSIQSSAFPNAHVFCLLDSIGHNPIILYKHLIHPCYGWLHRWHRLSIESPSHFITISKVDLNGGMVLATNNSFACRAFAWNVKINKFLCIVLHAGRIQWEAFYSVIVEISTQMANSKKKGDSAVDRIDHIVLCIGLCEDQAGSGNRLPSQWAMASQSVHQYFIPCLIHETHMLRSAVQTSRSLVR